MQRHLIFGIFAHLAMPAIALAQTATGVIRGEGSRFHWQRHH